MFSAGTLEYILTLGITISFAGFIIFAIRARKDISQAMRGAGVGRMQMLAALAVVIVFAAMVLSIVKPTQQLFFDDILYQGGALSMMHSGQAWQCNFGSPTQCFTGLIFHEPVGTAFNVAIAFAVGGVYQYSAYGIFFLLTALSVLLVFAITVLMLRKFIYGIYAELLFALSPALMVWAFPTTSDLTMLAYSLIAVFSIMVFIQRKNINTFGMVLFSISLAAYMKVDAAIYLVLIPLIFLILDDKSVLKSMHSNIKRVRRNLLNTKVLLLLLFFVIAISGELTYAALEYRTGGYGYKGTFIQNTCNPSSSISYVNVTHKIDLQNFGANTCANIAFWFDAFQGGITYYHIMQPIFFTFLGVIGVIVMLPYRRRDALALLIWFFAFFVLYTSFYAGSVTYGVDWRFVLSMIAQVSILGGFGAGAIILAAKRFAGQRGYIAAVLAVSLLIAYSFYSMVPDLGVNPSSIGQAQQARFYQNFVYANANAIPRSCLVFSFDPELFNLNGLSSIQFGNITSAYTQSGLVSYHKDYPCLVVDYGYWCHTARFGGLCNTVKGTFNLSAIAVTVDNFSGTADTFGLYRVNGLR
ncbi:conserved hypothetical protein, membrane [mine drainage metagenome]|uniref:Glycosyltransferase RgtA/B/C/D-like domain-containing protein n=1 Tax=mine drainage metagenome TaxID=410659 RepID=T1AG45_9ZZZZ